MAKTLNKDYISLHQHSIGSLRDCIITISDHVKYSLEHNKKYIAITDHGSISEWIELYNQTQKNNLIPIYGIEGYISFNRDKIKDGKPDHLILLATNKTGFKNIIKIHNDSWRNFYKKPIMSYDFLFNNNDGIIVTSGCYNGTLPKLIVNNENKQVDDYINKMKEVFKNRFYVELMFIEMKEQKELNKKLVMVAKKHNLPILINSDAHFLTEDDAKIHQLSLLLQSGKTIKDLKEKKAWEFSAKDLYLKDEKSLYRYFVENYYNDPIITKDVVCQATWNVNDITSSIEEIYLEHPPRLPHFKNGKKILTNMVMEGLIKKVEQGKIKNDKVDLYIERAKYEIETISKMDLVDYFLLIYDIVDWCKKNDIAVGPGRGCFLPSSKIEMCNGEFKQISDVVVGDFVRNRSYCDVVIDKMQFSINEKIVVLSTENCKDDICCTRDHKIMIYDEIHNKLKWRKAKDIIEGDILVKTQTFNKWNKGFVFGDRVVKKFENFYKGVVYDLTIGSDHSYNVNGYIVHNSVSASLVTWLIGITKLDPIENNFIFERFLNPARKTKLKII